MDDLIKEHIKCRINPVYAIEKYFKIHDIETKELIPFKLTDNQKELITGMELYPYNIAKTSRYIGGSIALAALVAVKLSFCDLHRTEESEKIIYMSNNSSLSNCFIKQVKLFSNYVPKWVWGESNKLIYITDKINELKLPNNNSLKAVNPTKDSLRGYRPTELIIDKAGEINDFDEILSNAMASMSPIIGSKLTIVSNPNSNTFKKLYEDAMHFRNSFNTIDLTWAYDLRYNENLIWYKDDEVMAELDYTRKSISRMFFNGWKPSSPWYENIAKYYKQAPKYLDQEINGLFT